MLWLINCVNPMFEQKCMLCMAHANVKPDEILLNVCCVVDRYDVLLLQRHMLFFSQILIKFCQQPSANFSILFVCLDIAFRLVNL